VSEGGGVFEWALAWPCTSKISIPASSAKLLAESNFCFGIWAPMSDGVFICVFVNMMLHTPLNHMKYYFLFSKTEA
jgi:hypothetical protein